MRVANLLVGNPESAAGLEIVFTGPTLRFDEACLIAVTGAEMPFKLDGVSQSPWQSIQVEKGQTLEFDYLRAGARCYLSVSGGIDVPLILTPFFSTAIATLRTLNIGIKDEHIQKGIVKILNLARLQEIKSGKLKNLVKNNKLIVDGSHNESGSKALNKYLETLNCNKHVIIGMMINKEHEKYINYFKNVASITTIDLKTQPNSISGKDLKEKFKNIPNIQYQSSIEKAIKSIDLKEGDLLLITGSLYGAAEVLSLN